METNKIPATLTVSIVDGRPVLKTSADFMGAGCGSSIGQLVRATAQDSGTLRQVIFSFTGGRCVAADHVVMNVFQRTGDGRVKVYAWVEQSYVSNVNSEQSSAGTETDRIGRFTAEE